MTTEDKSGAVHHDDVAQADKLGVEVQEVVAHRITEEDLLQHSRDALSIRSKGGLRILGIMFVMGCNMAGYGIDWGVISGINSMQRWHDYFGFPNDGVIIATINALMTIGGFCGAPFLALGDVIGRRGVNWVGNALVIVASLMQGLAPNLACLMAGRFVLGFGTALCSAPQYIAEVAPIHLRGRLVGIFGACFQVGSLIMLAAMMGFTKWDNDWMWRLPFILEAVFPLIVCVFLYIVCPESPRYLIMKGHRDRARKMITQFMTSNGDENDPIVPIMMNQIDESLETSNTGVRAAYDYRVFFTREVGYRTVILVLYSIFQQWNGGGIIGQYMSPALETVGITDTLAQLGITFGTTSTYFVFTAFGAYLVDKFRRRTLIFAGLLTFILWQTAVTITSWQYEKTESRAAAVLTVVWVFCFQACSAALIATMHNLYPVELLSLPLRAKGMGLYAMVQGAAGVVNNYGISVGIDEVGYKIWVVFIVYNCLQLIAAYFLFPETSKLSLEQMDRIFETKGQNPVKISLVISKAQWEKDKIDREQLAADRA
ncbi:sugar transporter [Zalerion maritima]|uniref:Sugar transporter n=1 Tax=Zalerion maritima TaxID=339359 RepID=A0AAD5RZ42_9PEZI|nr:sugar transporter [Zalerion maritima]